MVKEERLRLFLAPSLFALTDRLPRATRMILKRRRATALVLVPWAKVTDGRVATALQRKAKQQAKLPPLALDNHHYRVEARYHQMVQRITPSRSLLPYAQEATALRLQSPLLPNPPSDLEVLPDGSQDLIVAKGTKTEEKTKIAQPPVHSLPLRMIVKMKRLMMMLLVGKAWTLNPVRMVWTLIPPPFEKVGRWAGCLAPLSVRSAWIWASKDRLPILQLPPTSSPATQMDLRLQTIRRRLELRRLNVQLTISLFPVLRAHPCATETTISTSSPMANIHGRWMDFPGRGVILT